MKQASLRQLKTRIKSLKNFQKMTKSVNLISAVKLRKVQGVMTQSRNLGSEILSLLHELKKRNEKFPKHALFGSGRRTMQDKKILVITIASDRGLAGTFDLNIFRRTEVLLDEIGVGNYDLATIGKKAKAHFSQKQIPLLFSFERFGNIISREQTKELRDYVRASVEKETYASIQVIFNNFISILKQEAIVVQLYPIDPKTLPDVIEHLSPKKNPVVEKSDAYAYAYLLEPNAQKLVDVLAELSFSYLLYVMILEANSSEAAARMITMQRAYENATDMIFESTLAFNKLRQGKITQELLELVSGSKS